VGVLLVVFQRIQAWWHTGSPSPCHGSVLFPHWKSNRGAEATVEDGVDSDGDD
jgi:hypothetical protein